MKGIIYMSTKYHSWVHNILDPAKGHIHELSWIRYIMQ